MKGVVFNLLEEAVLREFGPETWEDLLDDADVSGAYTSLGNYSDDEIVALVAAAASKLGMTNGEVLRWFGQRAMPILRERYPALFENHSSARSFILSVNNIIHPEVRKLYSGASCPFFHFRESENGRTVTMGYESSRKMCDLAHGFVKGAAKIFCEEVDIVHHTCMNHGADRCVMEMQWAN
ncbi:heme NO-binding domain-containing protein [Sinorhizobium fredii]|uniref:heme NO-binding domain-containing protein n=1 Tax=Rhizobium fredii TaxID=380 RepID=UPI00059569E8|nr:heme NO-binding domain-containing protein [Sinorhizobium fredii]WOS66031.1 heme NO-binding domain-containing protein [Sinorhizobium fredii GR64]